MEGNAGISHTKGKSEGMKHNEFFTPRHMHHSIRSRRHLDAAALRRRHRGRSARSVAHRDDQSAAPIRKSAKVIIRRRLTMHHTLLYFRISRTSWLNASSTLIRCLAEVSMNLQPKCFARSRPSTVHGHPSANISERFRACYAASDTHRSFPPAARTPDRSCWPRR